MPSSQERVAVLTMIQQGTITAEQGLELLNALGDKQKNTTSPAAIDPVEPPRNGHWFRIKVSDLHSGRDRVNIRLPVNMLTTGMKMGARFSPQIEGVDPERLVALVQSGQVGKIVDVTDQIDGEHIEISIE